MLDGAAVRRVALLAAVLATLPRGSRAQATDAGPRGDELGKLITAVRDGGTSVVCRHAITGSFDEREPVSYEDPSTQRRLSREGERQSRRMGEAFRSLGLRFGEVISSPMQRALRTALLMEVGEPLVDSAWHTNGGDYGGPAREARLAALAASAPENRLVISHVVTMTSVLPEAKGRLDEGDCVIVRSGVADGGFDVLGVIPWRAWIRAARTGLPSS